MSNKRILGIDYGSKRVGIAVSDEGLKFALPVSVIENNEDLLNKVIKIAKDYDVQIIVMGESRNYKGEVNPIFFASMEFKKQLEAQEFTVHLEPEFMTSVQAERWQGKNDMLDASASAIILQSYLDRSDLGT
jgi:putative Holliday junction resolvase